jgi:hypothetical protein
MAINEKYSYKDFTGQYLTDRPASEFNNSEIIGSCFHIGNEPFSDVFPPDMTGVTFTKCSLSNCNIPVGNTVGAGCQHRQINIQNDGEQWLLDKDEKPTEPLDKKRFQDLGLSIDPKDIPVTKLDTNITLQKEQDNHQADIDAVKAWNPDLAERLGIE